MSDARTALEAIGLLPDAEIDLADAALHLARVDAPDADWQAVRAHLSQLAREAHALDAGDDLASRVEGLSALLVDHHGYHGDNETYDDLANANMIEVVQRRRGMPISLGILWLHCAQAAGWSAHGIDFPGHFMIALEGDGVHAVLDVFAGGYPMDARTMRALLKDFEGENAELRPGLLRPMSHRAVLLRLQNNIKLRRMTAGDLSGALSCAQDMLRVAPQAAPLWREAGLLNQRLDQVGDALRCYGRFVELNPEGDAAERTRRTMEELRTRLN